MAKKKKKSKIPKNVRKKIQERKSVKKAILDSQEKLLQRAKERSIETGVELRIAPPTTEKMSEIVVDYAKPFLDVATNAEEQKRAIAIAVIIWNLSLFPEEVHSDKINEIKRIMGASNKTDDPSDDDSEVVNYMMERRKLRFPDINRMVVDYEFVETPEGFHLNIVSNILEDKFNSKNL